MRQCSVPITACDFLYLTGIFLPHFLPWPLMIQLGRGSKQNKTVGITLFFLSSLSWDVWPEISCNWNFRISSAAAVFTWSSFNSQVRRTVLTLHCLSGDKHSRPAFLKDTENVASGYDRGVTTERARGRLMPVLLYYRKIPGSTPFSSPFYLIFTLFYCIFTLEASKNLSYFRMALNSLCSQE